VICALSSKTHGIIGIWNWRSRSLSSVAWDSLEQQQQSILKKEASIRKNVCHY